MAAKKKYDFFISYRRANNGTVCGSYLVGLLSDYNVFYDVDSITEGTFDTQIREALQNTERFILVVTEGSFDRPEVPGKRDWYYEEIGLAIETVGLDRITPVVFSGSFNEDILPESLKNRGLRSCQVVKYVAEYAKYFKDEFFHHFGLDATTPAKNVQSPTREQVEDDDYDNHEDDNVEDEEYEKDVNWEDAELDDVIAAAEDGNPYAQVELGDRYDLGCDVKQNYNKAAQWYKLAAEQGNADAQLKLGDYYDLGYIKGNQKEMFRWYKEAADQGVAEAQHNVGNCYYYGTGVREDEAEAVKWFIKAANQQYAEAQFSLGKCYYNGEGVKQNLKKAKEYFELAAEQEYEEAINFLNENEF